MSLTDVTGQYVTFAVWGPLARTVLARTTPADLGDKAFPFMTAQELTVGDVPVRALRVTFVGELGWELYASAEYGPTLWRTLWQAGEADGMTACGYRAIDSLRLEKGYRVWSTDITPETTPYEAGLGFCVKLDHPGKPDGFIGDDALRAAKAAGLHRRLACITLEDPRQVVLGSEPVRVRDTCLGRLPGGGQGSPRAATGTPWTPRSPTPTCPWTTRRPAPRSRSTCSAAGCREPSRLRRCTTRRATASTRDRLTAEPLGLSRSAAPRCRSGR